MNDKVKRLLEQLLREVQAVGATTAELLNDLDDTSEAHRIINELDSIISIWEDDIEELQAVE